MSAILLLGFTSVRGQNAPSSPQGATLPADAMLNEMLHSTAPATAPSASPTTRPQNFEALLPVGVSGETPASKLLREGSNVLARKGHLRRVPDCPYPQIMFETSPDQLSLQPMLILPNLQLMSMESAIAATKSDQLFTVSGTISECDGRNYILLEPGPDELSTPAAPETSLKPDASAVTPDLADKMLDDMLASAKTNKRAGTSSDDRNTTPTSYAPSQMGVLAAAVAPGPASTNIIREKSWIMDRAARMQRSQDGQYEELVFDADGSAMQDPPLIILPNLKLQAVEAAEASGNGDPRFIVTGTVTEYRGKNYILLQKVVVMPLSAREF
jgi:hypothetical protein